MKLEATPSVGREMWFTWKVGRLELEGIQLKKYCPKPSWVSCDFCEEKPIFIPLPYILACKYQFWVCFRYCFNGMFRPLKVCKPWRPYKPCLVCKNSPFRGHSGSPLSICIAPLEHTLSWIWSPLFSVQELGLSTHWRTVLMGHTFL